MVVKKTKAGRFTIALSFELRDRILQALIHHFQGMNTFSLSHQSGVFYHLYSHTLHEFFKTKAKEFSPAFTGAIKLTIPRSHAIALMWLLRHYDDDMAMLELKSELHKTLQP